jgi:hypothetical protein
MAGIKWEQFLVLLAVVVAGIFLANWLEKRIPAA